MKTEESSQRSNSKVTVMQVAKSRRQVLHPVPNASGKSKLPPFPNPCVPSTATTKGGKKRAASDSVSAASLPTDPSPTIERGSVPPRAKKSKPSTDPTQGAATSVKIPGLDDASDECSSEQQQQPENPTFMVSPTPTIPTESACYSNLMKMASNISKLDPSVLSNMETVTKLSTLPVPCVMVVVNIESHQTFFGLRRLCTIVYFDDAAVKRSTKTILPDRLFDGSNPLTANKLVVYFGLKEKKIAGNGGSNLYHDFRQMVLDATVGAEDMVAHAKKLSQMDAQKLLERCTVCSVSTLPPCSAFAYSRLRELKHLNNKTKTEERALILLYTDTSDGTVSQKEVYIPERYEEDLKRNMPGIMVYKGLRKSESSGREYHDLAFLSGDDAHNLLMNNQKTENTSNTLEDLLADFSEDEEGFFVLKDK